MRDLLRSPLARLWVPVLGPAAGLAYLDRGTDAGDLVYFVHRGEQLLSGGWADTFADPKLQSGPLQLAIFGAVRDVAALAFLIELGMAVLLLAPRLTRALAGACVQAAVVAVMLAPFALAGTFRMFDHQWQVTSGTLVGLVVGPGAHFGWSLRLAQASLAIGAG